MSSQGDLMVVLWSVPLAAWGRGGGGGMFIKRGVVDTPEGLWVVYLVEVNRMAWQRRYY